MIRLVLVWLCLAASGAAWAGDTYEIGLGDVLHIVVVSQPSLTGDFSVDADGMLTLEILGKVKASGMSPRELERKLTTLLADGYLKKPQVSVSVREYRSQRVFVTGEVQKPGPYALKSDRSLLALLGDLGVLGPNAGVEIIVIRPPEPSGDGAEPSVTASTESILQGQVPGAEVFRVSVRELLSGNPDRNMLLQNGDTVYVPKAANFYVTGHVAKPGPYKFQEGLTIQQALSLAGGLTERGSDKGIKIVRIVDGERKEIKVKFTDLVQPEDTIVVRERFF